MRVAMTMGCLMIVSILGTGCLQQKSESYKSSGKLMDQAKKETLAKRYTAAIKHWKELAKKEPLNSEVFYWLGDTFYRLKKYDLAEENLKKSLNLNPKNGDAMFVLAHLYMQQKRYDESEALLKQLRESYPNYPGVDKMLEDVRRMRTGEPDEYEAAQKAMKAKKYDKAIEHWQNLAKIDPKNSEYFSQMGNAYNQKKEYGKAEQNLKQSLKLNPKNPDALYILADVYYKMDREEEAMDLLKKLEKVDPKYPGIDRLRKAIEKKRNS